MRIAAICSKTWLTWLCGSLRAYAWVEWFSGTYCISSYDLTWISCNDLWDCFHPRQAQLLTSCLFLWMWPSGVSCWQGRLASSPPPSVSYPGQSCRSQSRVVASGKSKYWELGVLALAHFGATTLLSLCLRVTKCLFMSKQLPLKNKIAEWHLSMTHHYKISDWQQAEFIRDVWLLYKPYDEQWNRGRKLLPRAGH